MWSSDALVDATVLGETTRFLGPVVGLLAVVALKELALRFALYHNLVPGVLLVMIVITRRRGFTTGADPSSCVWGHAPRGRDALRCPPVVEVTLRPRSLKLRLELGQS